MMENHTESNSTSVTIQENEALDQALTYASRGWPVFRIVFRDKIPLFGGFPSATISAAEINDWGRQGPFNVAIATGSGAGFFVVDLDPKIGIGVDDCLAALESQVGKLPPTYTVHTPSGGIHLYFSSKQRIRCFVAILPGVDVRGDGGYVVAPPSIGENGAPYFADDCEINEIAAAPCRLISFLTTRPSKPEALRAIFSNQTVEMGSRNDSLVKILGSLLGRRLPLELSMQLVSTYNQEFCKPPLNASELNNIFESIAGRELRKRRGK
jgi:putative DNA primase/helicase